MDQDPPAPPDGATPARRVTDELLRSFGIEVQPASGEVYTFLPATVWVKARAKAQTDKEPKAETEPDATDKPTTAT
jgi:hypothetical protein